MGTDALSNDPVPVPARVWVGPNPFEPDSLGIVRWTYQLPPAAPPTDGVALPYLMASTAGMLGAVLSLDCADDVPRFVRRYGPIGFCLPHRLPVAHNPAPMNPAADTPDWWRLGAGQRIDPPEGEPTWCYVPSLPPGVHFERVESYLNLGRSLRAGLSIAAKLREASPENQTPNLGTDEEWAAYSLGVYTHAPLRAPDPATGEPGDDSPVRVYVGRYRFSIILHQFTSWARFRPGLDWKKDAPSPRFVFEADAFGTLLYQFIAAVTDAHSIARCDGCGRAYPREGNKAPKGRKNWCPDCRTTRLWREAKRNSRARADIPREARACARCGTAFQPRRHDQRTCGASCPALTSEPMKGEHHVQTR